METNKEFFDCFENRPSKDVFEKCLLDLVIEKAKIMATPDYNKILIEKIDKVIESIEIYLSVASR